MPKVDVAAVPARRNSGYPPPFDAPCADMMSTNADGRFKRKDGTPY